MSDPKEVKFSLEVLLNKEETKVLFAQVDGDFADVLISFLILPLGTIVRLLKKHYGDEAPIFGSLTNLYNSVENLNTELCFWTDAGKLMLLNPRSSLGAEYRKLKLNIDDTKPAKYLTCEERNCASSSNISMFYGARCSRCGKTMNREICLQGSKNSTTAANDDGVFTIKTLSFLISDDMRMVPMVMGSIIQNLCNHGITDLDHGAKIRTLAVGFGEIMDLLRGCLLSRTPLTDLILHKRRTMVSTISVNSGLGSLLHQTVKQESSNSEKMKKKMILKVTVQKSTNRLLVAQAEEDFIDFLFSFLTIPLGGVKYLLGSDTCLVNIDNLYRSVANLNKYLKTPSTINSILKPELPPMYLSKNQFLSLSQQKTPHLYYYQGGAYGPECLPSYIVYKGQNPVCFSDPKGQGSLVRGPRVYMVCDDLTVESLCLSSALSILKSKSIPLSDIKEVEIEIGVEEALSILEASLTSTRALTDGLSHILNQTRKNEDLMCVSS